MNKIAEHWLLIFLLLIGLKVFPQVNDAGLWISANVEKNITQSFGLSFSEEIRLMENMSEASTIFSDISLEFRFNKHLKASTHYRFINDRRLDDSYASRNRLYFDVSYRQKFSLFVLSVRERIQSQFDRVYSSEGNATENYSRSKATLKLDMNRRISPYLSSEWFHPFNDPSVRFIDKARYMVGIEYQFSPWHMLDFNYLIQRSFRAIPGNDFVIGIGYFRLL